MAPPAPRTFRRSAIPAVNVATVPQRSPLRYPGGKTWLVPHIRKWLAEPVGLLVEPFAGGGIDSLTAVMERLTKRAVMVELDRDVAAFWHAALEHPEELQLAREVPFMQSVVTQRAAGKIDLVIAVDRHELRWFGLEIQAVYFSGSGMDVEFEALRKADTVRPPFPMKHRRPDWRSSSANRLMPQLQVKGPALRLWNSKIAVAVDAPFFDSIGGPSETPEHDLKASVVIWLVPELRGDRFERGHWEVLTLEAS